MSLLCSSDCLATTFITLTPYCDKCAKPSIRKSGGALLHLVKCTYQFADIQDPAEWAAAVDSGDVVSLPLGKWELPAPTTTTEKVTGCGTLIETSRTYSVPFETACTSEKGDDFAFWLGVSEDCGLYRIVPQSCDGIFYICTDYFNQVYNNPADPGTVAGSSPGLEFSFSVPPYEDRAGDTDNIVYFKATLDIKSDGMIPGIKLPGVSAAL